MIPAGAVITVLLAVLVWASPAAAAPYPDSLLTGPDYVAPPAIVGGHAWLPSTNDSLYIDRSDPLIMEKLSASGLEHTPGAATGPDGNVWVTETDSGQIARVVLGSYVSQSFSIRTSNGPQLYLEYVQPLSITRYPATPHPYSIITGPDGNLWFTDGAPDNLIGRMTPDGTLTTYPVPAGGRGPFGIAVGNDGAIWASEPPNPPVYAGQLIRVSLDGKVSAQPWPAPQTHRTARTSTTRRQRLPREKERRVAMSPAYAHGSARGEGMCKNGGWLTFGTFKNQGDCVSFVGNRPRRAHEQASSHRSSSHRSVRHRRAGSRRRQASPRSPGPPPRPGSARPARPAWPARRARPTRFARQPGRSRWLQPSERELRQRPGGHDGTRQRGVVRCDLS